MRRAVFVSVLLVVAALAGGRAQAPATVSTGLLMGTIVDALSDQPVANVQVTLGGATTSATNTQILTDAEGHFVFTDLPRGTYTITAVKAGYVDGAYGRRRPGGLFQSLVLADAERIGDLQIPIWKYAAITGTIRDEADDPMVDVPVRVLQPTYVAGKLKLTPGAIARTDDRGVYRIASLAPGDYVVAVPSTQTTAPQSVVEFITTFRGSGSGPDAADLYRDFSLSGATIALTLLGRPGVPSVGGLAFQSLSGNMRAGVMAPSRDGRLYVYPTQYFPAATAAGQATRIAVRSGEERAGVDMHMELVATSRVSGTVTGPSGPLIAVMTLTPETSELSADTDMETATTLSDAAGRFTFLGVPPGTYQLHAVRASVPASGASRGGPPPAARPTTTGAPSSPVGPGSTLTATRTITVGATDTDDLAVIVRPGFRVGGRAEFANAATPPDPDDLRRMSAAFDPADARPLVSATIGRGQFDETGGLSSYQLPPGRYYLRINNAPPGWTFKSATWNGQDISNVPLDLDRDVSNVVITFTAHPSTLSGQVRNASGAADVTATVLVFPDDPRSWADYGNFPRRMRAIRADRAGRYTTIGLPAGKYLVAAIPDEASVNWQNPATLQALTRLATAITLDDGESHQTALTTVAVSQ